MEIRRCTAADRDQVLALAPRLLVGMAAWNDPAASLAAARRWVSDSMARAGDEHPVFVAAADERVLGLVTVGRTTHFTGRVEAHVGELVVAAEASRLGVGRALMTAAEGWAAAQGLGRLSLVTGAANAGARAFYAALGYVEEEVRLSRPLKPPSTGIA